MFNSSWFTFRLHIAFYSFFSPSALMTVLQKHDTDEATQKSSEKGSNTKMLGFHQPEKCF